MRCADNDCKALLNRVYEAGFAMDDVALYLDTHPSDQEALNYYYYVSNLQKEAVKAYEAQCGPLMFERVDSQSYWTWVNDPWPWEGVCG